MGSPVLATIWAMAPHFRWGSHSLLSACPGSGLPAATASPSPRSHPSSRKLTASAEARWESAEHGELAGNEEAKSEEDQQEKHSLQRGFLLPSTSLLALHHAGEVWAVYLRKWLLAEWNKREHKMFCVQYQKYGERGNAGLC